MKISIVIVGYNEENNIGSTLRTINQFFRSKYKDYEIIFVNDGSTDSTLNVVKNLSKTFKLKIISNKKNKGKGFVVRQGMLSAKGDIIIITDADLAYPIEQIGPFIDAMNDFDLAVGSRMHKDSLYLMNNKCFNFLLLRHITSRIFNAYARFLFNIPATDTQCGIKVMRKELAKRIAAVSKTNGFGYDVELFVIAKKLGAKIIELPVRVIQAYPDSKVIIWKHSPKMFLEVLKIKYNNLKGVYDLK